MGWLKRIGGIVVKSLQIATGFMPLVQGVAKGTEGEKVVNQISDDLTKIAGAVSTVEVVFAAVNDPAAKTGAQKLQAVTPLIQQIILQSEIMVGKKIHNEQAFITACQTIGGGVADLLNAIEND